MQSLLVCEETCAAELVLLTLEADRVLLRKCLKRLFFNVTHRIELFVEFGSDTLKFLRLHLLSLVFEPFELLLPIKDKRRRGTLRLDRFYDSFNIEIEFSKPVLLAVM